MEFINLEEEAGFFPNPDERQKAELYDQLDGDLKIREDISKSYRLIFQRVWLNIFDSFFLEGCPVETLMLNISPELAPTVGQLARWHTWGTIGTGLIVCVLHIRQKTESMEMKIGLCKTSCDVVAAASFSLNQEFEPVSGTIRAFVKRLCLQHRGVLQKCA